VDIFYEVAESSKTLETDLSGFGSPRNYKSDYFIFEIKRPNAFFTSDGESTLVESFVIIRLTALRFSSREKLVVENRRKRRRTISNLDSLLGSMLPT